MTQSGHSGAGCFVALGAEGDSATTPLDACCHYLSPNLVDRSTVSRIVRLRAQVQVVDVQAQVILTPVKNMQGVIKHASGPEPHLTCGGVAGSTPTPHGDEGSVPSMVCSNATSTRFSINATCNEIVHNLAGTIYKACEWFAPIELGPVRITQIRRSSSDSITFRSIARLTRSALRSVRCAQFSQGLALPKLLVVSKAECSSLGRTVTVRAGAVHTGKHITCKAVST